MVVAKVMILLVAMIVMDMVNLMVSDKVLFYHIERENYLRLREDTTAIYIHTHTHIHIYYSYMYNICLNLSIKQFITCFLALS